jgi:DNA replicative helicase MCM subunit Mcm2 (Cdc46/Mcm family)
MYSASFGSVDQTTSRRAVRRAGENIPLVADPALVVKHAMRYVHTISRVEIQTEGFSASARSLHARGQDSLTPVLVV